MGRFRHISSIVWQWHLPHPNISAHLIFGPIHVLRPLSLDGPTWAFPSWSTNMHMGFYECIGNSVRHYVTIPLVTTWKKTCFGVRPTLDDAKKIIQKNLDRFAGTNKKPKSPTDDSLVNRHSSLCTPDIVAPSTVVTAPRSKWLGILTADETPADDTTFNSVESSVLSTESNFLFRCILFIYFSSGRWHKTQLVLCLCALYS